MNDSVDPANLDFVEKTDPLPPPLRLKLASACGTMKAVRKRLLLFAATTGYQIREFADAAHRLGLELTLATDHCDRMGDPWGDGALAVKFDHRMMGSLDALRRSERASCRERV